MFTHSIFWQVVGRLNQIYDLYLYPWHNFIWYNSSPLLLCTNHSFMPLLLFGACKSPNIFNSELKYTDPPVIRLPLCLFVLCHTWSRPINLVKAFIIFVLSNSFPRLQHHYYMYKTCFWIEIGHYKLSLLFSSFPFFSSSFLLSFPCALLLEVLF